MCTCNGKCQLKKDLQDPPMIVQHLKNTHGNKIGTMVAIANENIVLIGFSKCKKDIDKFDNQIGTEIAITRAYKWKDRKYVAIGGEFDSRNEEATDWTEIVDVPYSMDYDLYKFIRRCERYFKNINIYSTWISQLIENDWLNEKYQEETRLKYITLEKLNKMCLNIRVRQSVNQQNLQNPNHKNRKDCCNTLAGRECTCSNQD